MIDVIVLNSTGAKKFDAKLHTQNGLLECADNSWSSVTAEVSRGCSVVNAPKIEVPLIEKKEVSLVSPVLPSAKGKKAKSK